MGLTISNFMKKAKKWSFNFINDVNKYLIFMISVPFFGGSEARSRRAKNRLSKANGSVIASLRRLGHSSHRTEPGLDNEFILLCGSRLLRP